MTLGLDDDDGSRYMYHNNLFVFQWGRYELGAELLFFS